MNKSRARLAQVAVSGAGRTAAPGGAEKRPQNANMSDSPGEPLWGVAECAAYLSISTRTLRALVDDARIPHFWLDRSPGWRWGLRFVPELIRRWATDQSVKECETE